MENFPTEFLNYPLTDSLIFLAIDDWNERIYWSASSYFSYLLAAGILTDLYNRGIFILDRKKIYLTQISQRLDNLTAIHHEVAYLLRLEQKPRSLGYWIERIPRKIKSFKQKMLEELQNRGGISLNNYKVLGIFSKIKYNVNQPALKYQLIAHCIQILQSAEGDNWSKQVISLLYAINCFGDNLPKDIQRIGKQYAKSLIKIEPFGHALREVISAMDGSTSAALFAAVSVCF